MMMIMIHDSWFKTLIEKKPTFSVYVTEESVVADTHTQCGTHYQESLILGSLMLSGLSTSYLLVTRWAVPGLCASSTCQLFQLMQSHFVAFSAPLVLPFRCASPVSLSSLNTAEWTLCDNQQAQLLGLSSCFPSVHQLLVFGMLSLNGLIHAYFPW